MKIKLYLKRESDPTCCGSGLCSSAVCSDKVSGMGTIWIWSTLFWN